MSWDAFWKRFDWLSRIDFARTLVTAVGGGVVAIASYLSDWSAGAIILATLVAGAAVSVVYIGFCKFWDRYDPARAPKVNPILAHPEADRNLAHQRQARALRTCFSHPSASSYRKSFRRTATRALSKAWRCDTRWRTQDSWAIHRRPGDWRAS